MSQEWFDDNCHTTDEFEAWWIVFYGVALDYVGTQDEQDTYWIRKGFAWHGWSARVNAQNVLLKALDKINLQ